MKKIVFIGDSLTEWFDWERRFPDYKVVNLGISGETVGELLHRIDDVIRSARDADFVFLMTGINNIASEDYGILSTFRHVVEKIIAGVNNGTIVIESILPVMLSWVDNKEIARINKSLKELASGLNIRYLDVFSLFMHKEGSALKDNLSPDGVHLSNQGYQIWSKAVEDFLRVR